jgi:hypothetical protein
VTTTQAPAEPTAGTQTPPAERPTDRPGGDSEVQQAAGAPGHAAVPPPSALPQLTRILGTIVAPTTLLTSVLFYFGWMHAYHFFDYFGVNSTVLGLTTQDYLMRSLDGLFVPMTVVACGGLLVLWGHAALRARLAAGSRPQVLHILVPVMATVGFVLAVSGLSSVFVVNETVLDRSLYGTAAPVSLALGVLLLMYAVHLWRSLTAEREIAGDAARPAWAAVAEWAAVFVLVGLSLFWAASNYSLAVGRGRAREQVANLPRQPSVAVYSRQSLSLSAPGVSEVRCRDPEAAYRFRYDGLKLVLQSGNQYLFLPEAWSPTDGVAIVMPRNDSLRIEFVPASARGTPRPSTC